MEMLLHSFFDLSIPLKEHGVLASNGHIAYRYLKNNKGFSMMVEVVSLSKPKKAFKLSFIGDRFKPELRFIKKTNLMHLFDFSDFTQTPKKQAIQEPEETTQDKTITVQEEVEIPEETSPILQPDQEVFEETSHILQPDQEVFEESLAKSVLVNQEEIAEVKNEIVELKEEIAEVKEILETTNNLLEDVIVEEPMVKIHF